MLSRYTHSFTLSDLESTFADPNPNYDGADIYMPLNDISICDPLLGGGLAVVTEGRPYLIMLAHSSRCEVYGFKGLYSFRASFDNEKQFFILVFSWLRSQLNYFS